MAYDQILAGKVRCALEDRKDVVEKAMFGGLTFMVSGNMCCGVHRDDLILRLDARTTVEELNNPHARPWDFMPSRPMPGMFAISAPGIPDQSAIDMWVALAVKHATSLPVKVKGAKARPASAAKSAGSQAKRAK